MENNKQTAVEWLIDWMKNNQYFVGNDLLQAIEQAKEREKQQIIEAYDQMRCVGNFENGEQYYNEEYGKQ